MSVCVLESSSEEYSDKSLRAAAVTARRVSGRVCCVVATVVRLAGGCFAQLRALTPPLSELRALAREILEHESREGLLPVLHRRRRLYRVSLTIAVVM
jgi:hypothetical protein